MELNYKTILTPSQYEFKDRGSTFIAYLFSVQNLEQVKKNIKSLKAQHPKAVHFCYAYQILQNDQNIQKAADDGEPSGSAGKPILGQILSYQITQNAIVVVRYFGGTLLGVPGLINAYKTAAEQVILQSTITTLPYTSQYQIDFDYNQQSTVMQILKKHSISITSQTLELFCIIKVAVPLAHINSFLTAFQNQHTITLKKL